MFNSIVLIHHHPSPQQIVPLVGRGRRCWISYKHEVESHDSQCFTEGPTTGLCLIQKLGHVHSSDSDPEKQQRSLSPLACRGRGVSLEKPPTYSQPISVIKCEKWRRNYRPPKKKKKLAFDLWSCVDDSGGSDDAVRGLSITVLRLRSTCPRWSS